MLSVNDTAITPKNKTSTKKNILTAVLAILAVAAVGAAIWLYTNPPQQNTPQTGLADGTGDLNAVLLSRTITNIPYMPTDFDSIVYAADAAGNVLYYEFNGTDFSEIPATGTLEVTVPLSGQQIPAKINYIERDGKICGYGVFSAVDTEGVYVYNFVMFKVTNLPAAYAADGRYLLLAYTDQTQAYTMDPIWEEAYVLNRTNATVTRFLSENNRTVGIDGAVRSDFCMITDGALTASTKVIPFFSSRNHQPSGNGDTPIDLYTKTDAKELSVALSLSDCYVKPLDNGAFAFVRKTSDGFNTVRYENGTESVISTFYSNYGTACMRSGDYLLSKEDGRIYTTYDDTVIETKGYKINPLLFAVSPDKKYVVMAGTVANALDYRIYVYNTETQKYTIFTETNYAAHANLRFINDTTVAFYVLNVDGFENVLLDVSSVR